MLYKIIDSRNKKIETRGPRTQICGDDEQILHSGWQTMPARTELCDEQAVHIWSHTVPARTEPFYTDGTEASAVHRRMCRGHSCPTPPTWYELVVGLQATLLQSSDATM